MPTWPEGGAAPITDIELVANKILVASPGGLLRYTVSGTLDPNFGTGGASMRAEIAAIDAAAPSGSTSETKLTSLWANPSGIIVRGTTAVIAPAYSVPSYAVTDWRWRLRA